MQYYDSVEEMQNALNNICLSVLNVIKEDVREEMQKIVLELAYIPEKPLVYNRTWEFLGAFQIVDSVVDKFVSDLLFDESKIITHDEMHHTISSQELFELLEAGENIGGINKVNNDGGFVEAIYQWLEENFYDKVIDEFGKRGIDLENI